MSARKKYSKEYQLEAVNLANDPNVTLKPVAEELYETLEFIWVLISYHFSHSLFSTSYRALYPVNTKDFQKLLGSSTFTQTLNCLFLVLDISSNALTEIFIVWSPIRIPKSSYRSSSKFNTFWCSQFITVWFRYEIAISFNFRLFIRHSYAE